MKSDTYLKNDVIEELAWEPMVNENRVGVEVAGGIVTLTGHVSSYAEKLAAERAVQRIVGVKGLVIDLDVEPSTSHKHGDTDIASAANTALSWDANIPRDAVKLMVEDGVLTLSGEVSREYQRAAAESAVRNLQGVKQIRNQIKIKPAILPQDVKEKIESALARQAHIDAQAISVTVEDDRITLSGTVSSWSERKAAVLAAWAAPGVSKVYDKMSISP